ncbi:MAG: FAD-dependent monooxygenase [Alphaproteobacteria bacterium]|nr:FAD-dependent monooxygenase [Alphaproteobacteria bacterium]
MSSSTDHPVIIAGAGPVGLSLALALQRRGIPAVVLDVRPEIARDPRATTVQPRTLESLAEWGVLDALASRATRVDTLQYWDWRNHSLLAELSYGLIASDTPYPFRLHVPQWELCEVLASRLDEGTVRWRHRVVDLEADDEQVLVDVTHNGVRETLRGQALVGADGVNSTVRRLLDLDLELGERDTFLTCEVDRSIAACFPEGIELGPCAHLFDGESWAIWMQMPDCIRLLFHVPDGTSAQEAMTDRAVWRRTRALIGEAGGETYNFQLFRSRATYHVQQRVVTAFRRGRVFLAGDAAHSAFPVGGMAMNAGIHDAEALAAALDDGSEAALDAWSTIRHAILRDEVMSESSAAHRALSASGLIQRWLRNRQIGELASDPVVAREHLKRLSMLAH